MRTSTGMGAGTAKSGFTLIEVMVAMSVLILVVMGMTSIFSQASGITSQGMTSTMRNSVGETAMETILQDVDGMIVNGRLGCYIEANATDSNDSEYGFGFDEIMFISTSGDQDDDMPYEYFWYHVEETTATNALGAEYVRFVLMKSRSIMANFDELGTYPLAKGQSEWWDRGAFDSVRWDEQVLAENVVRFDIYCKGWDGEDWMSNSDGTLHRFNSVEGPRKNSKLAGIPPAAFDIYMQITSPDAAMEGGMALVENRSSEVARKGREKMIRESATYFGRTVPLTGISQLHHPADHYLD